MGIHNRPVTARTDVRLLARNSPPEFLCGKCGKTATQICPECAWSGPEGLLCKTHAKKHSCGEEMLLPVVNSPRVSAFVVTPENNAVKAHLLPSNR